MLRPLWSLKASTATPWSTSWFSSSLPPRTPSYWPPTSPLDGPDSSSPSFSPSLTLTPDFHHLTLKQFYKVVGILNYLHSSYNGNT